MIKTKQQISFERLIKTGLVMTSSLLLVSCSLFSSKDGREDIDDGYMQAKQSKELQLPENTTELTVEDAYRVPEGVVITERDPKGAFLGLEPPHLLLIGGDGVREEANAAHPTVWIRNTSSEMSQFMDAFVEEKMIAVVSKDSRSLATDWIDSESESPIAQHLGSMNYDQQRHKFLVSILDEVNNEVGIQVQHLSGENYLDEQWVTANNGDVVAKQFLNYFIGYYDAARTEQAKARILKENIVEFKLGTNDANEMALVTEKDYQAVWQQMPSALEHLGFSIEDRDQSTGNYYVSLENDSGFWSGVFGSEQPETGLEDGDYLIKVKEHSGLVSLTFFSSSATAETLLSKEQMSKLYPEVIAAFRHKK